MFLATINGTAGIYSHGLNTGVTDLLASGPYSTVLTDGTLLAASTFDRRLDAGLLSNPTAVTTLTDDGGLYFVKDGLIGFTGVHNNETIGAELNDGSTTIPLAIFGSLDNTALQDGYVVFSEAGMRSWSRSSGETLILDALAPVLHTQGIAYLRTGRRPGALYRTTLP